MTKTHDATAYGSSGFNRGNSLNNAQASEGYRGADGQGNSRAGGTAQGESTSGNRGNGKGWRQEEINVPAPNWKTITGVVLVSGSELTVDTGSEDVIVGLGQLAYREEQGFATNVGDKIRIEGYEEEGEF